MISTTQGQRLWLLVLAWCALSLGSVANAQTITVTSTASPSSLQVAPGQTIQITSQFVSFSNLNEVSVSQEIFAPNGAAVGAFHKSLNLTAGVAYRQTYSFKVPTSTGAGTYKVRTGVHINKGWVRLHLDPNALSFSVVASAAPTAPTPTPTPAPTPAPAPVAAFTISSVSALNFVTPGQVLSAKAQVKSSLTVSNIKVLINVIDANYKLTGQRVFDSVQFTSGQSLPFQYDMVIPNSLPTGTYFVSVGVASSDWTKIHAWADKAAAFIVGTASQEPGTVTGTVTPKMNQNRPLSLVFQEEFTGDLRQWNDRMFWHSEPGYLLHDGSTFLPLPQIGVTTHLQNGMLLMQNKKCDNPYGKKMCGSELNTYGKFDNFMHGHIEARIKVPNNADGWSAFWLIGNGTGANAWPRTGEIDIFEFVNNKPATVYDNTPFFTTHWFGPCNVWNHCQQTYEWPALMRNYSADFHVWSFTRTRDYIEVYIDGIFFSRLTRQQLLAKGGNAAVIFDEPMHIILTQDGGGDAGGWADDRTRPAEEGTMYIDYIRAWKFD